MIAAGKNNCNIKKTIIYFIFSFLLLMPCNVYSKKNADVMITPVRKEVSSEKETTSIQKEKDEKVSQKEEENKKDFVYDPKNRKDPFRSLLFGTRIRKRTGKQLSPLQLIDLSTINLVGIIWGELGNKALVETPDGKSHVLTMGMIIGKNDGKIIQIKNDKVTIVEDYLDYLGNKKQRYVYLNLQKEGDEDATTK